MAILPFLVSFLCMLCARGAVLVRRQADFTSVPAFTLQSSIPETPTCRDGTKIGEICSSDPNSRCFKDIRPMPYCECVNGYVEQSGRCVCPAYKQMSSNGTCSCPEDRVFELVGKRKVQVFVEMTNECVSRQLECKKEETFRCALGTGDNCLQDAPCEPCVNTCVRKSQNRIFIL